LAAKFIAPPKIANRRALWPAFDFCRNGFHFIQKFRRMGRFKPPAEKMQKRAGSNRLPVVTAFAFGGARYNKFD
jgi:hypothetical protein